MVGSGKAVRLVASAAVQYAVIVLSVFTSAIDENLTFVSSDVARPRDYYVGLSASVHRRRFVFFVLAHPTAGGPGRLHSCILVSLLTKHQRTNIFALVK